MQEKRKPCSQYGSRLYFDGTEYVARTINDAEALEGLLNKLEDDRLAQVDALASERRRISELRNEIGALSSGYGTAFAVADRLGKLLLDTIDGASVEGAIARRYVEDQLELVNIADRAAGREEVRPR